MFNGVCWLQNDSCHVRAAEVTWILVADSAVLYMLFLTMCWFMTGISFMGILACLEGEAKFFPLFLPPPSISTLHSYSCESYFPAIVDFPASLKLSLYSPVNSRVGWAALNFSGAVHIKSNLHIKDNLLNVPIVNWNYTVISEPPQLQMNLSHSCSPNPSAASEPDKNFFSSTLLYRLVFAKASNRAAGVVKTVFSHADFEVLLCSSILPH